MPPLEGFTIWCISLPEGIAGIILFSIGINFFNKKKVKNAENKKCKDLTSNWFIFYFFTLIIRLNGLKVKIEKYINVEIEIIISGLRPDEELFERLI